MQNFREFRSTRIALVIAGLAVSASYGPALALDGNDLVAKFDRALAKHGQIGLSAASVDVSGNNVTLNGVRFKLPESSQGGKDLPLGTVRLSGVAEENGAYRIERADFENIRHSEEKFTANVSDLYLTKLFVPANPDTAGLDAFLLYENAHAGRTEITHEGRTVLSIDETVATTTPSPDRSSFDFAARIATIRGDFTGAGKPHEQEIVRRLGVEKVEGEITLNGRWTLADGRFVLDEYAFDFANVGKLDIKLDFSGYTVAFLEELTKANAAIEAASGNPEESQKAGLAIFALLQQLSINSAEIRFDDAGITNRGIDLAASQQGSTPDQIKQLVKAMTPMVLAQFQLADLQNSVTDAVSRYIDAPENFSIKAQPSKPVALPAIIGAGVGAPQTLPALLGVSVTANQ